MSSFAANVVVVDNRSEDDSVDVAIKAGARVVRMPTNAGYSSACNQGTRQIGSSAHWIAFVNPDVAIREEDLRELTTDVPEEIWALTPLTTTLDGRPQAGVARPTPTPWVVAAMYMGLTRTKAPVSSLNFDGRDRYYYADVVSGSCLLVRRRCLDLVGGWDEAFFFNCEDIDICVRIGAAGGRVAVDRTVRVAHDKAHSSSSASSEARRLEGARAFATYFQIHGSRWGTTLVVVTAYLGCLMRHFAERVFLRSRRSLRPPARFGRLSSVLWITMRQAYLGRQPVRPAQAVFLDP
jgi:N-acetylglucosaminyl-diphospho-decaprenol L-rhamnosyltransferase